MEVKINEHESYKVDLPSDIAISKEQFLGLIDRLKVIEKVISNDVFRWDKSIARPPKFVQKQPKIQQPVQKQQPTQQFQVNTSQRAMKQKYTRDMAVRIMYLYYNVGDTFEERAKVILKEFPMISIHSLQQSIHDFKRKFNVQPREVNMTQFPKVGNRKSAGFKEYRIVKNGK
jgi:hypothetical protein